jgi:hypothetical protein
VTTQKGATFDNIYGTQSRWTWILWHCQMMQGIIIVTRLYIPCSRMQYSHVTMFCGRHNVPCGANMPQSKLLCSSPSHLSGLLCRRCSGPQKEP